MATRGRKPKPTALKVLPGTRADRAPRPGPGRAGAPAPPPYLDGEALAEWGRIVPQLAEAGVLAGTDAAAIAIYCTVFARWRKAIDQIEAEGITGSTALGGEKSSPAVAVAERAEALLAKLLAEFGATPSSRSRVGGVATEAPPDKLSAFLDRRKKG